MKITLNKDESKQPSTPLQYLTYFLEMALQTIHHPQESAAAIQKAMALAKDLNPYLNQYIPPESEALKALAYQTQITQWDELYANQIVKKRLVAAMQCGAYEGHFLKMMAQLVQAREILEIGMFTGYSTVCMASALPKEGCIVTCEEELYLTEYVKPFFEKSGYQQQIEVRLGPALETIKKLIEENRTFDMIFIDANKAEYIDYYNLIKEGNLLADKGVICVDNTLMKGIVYSSKAKKTTLAKSVARFNQRVKQDKAVEQIILPIRDGLSVIRKVA